MKKVSILLLALTALLSCNSKDEGVIIHTEGIFTPVLFSIDGQNASGKTFDFGEHILTDKPRPILVRVHNSTQFPYTDLDLVTSADGENVPSITFVPNASGEIAFPGYEGDCGHILLPGKSCEIRLIYSPRDEREYRETITLSFKNYVESETHSALIKVLAGMPASLVFTNDETIYSFGEKVGLPPVPVVERAEPILYTQELEVINAGGLYARNIHASLAQTCTSTLTRECPTGMGNVYSMTNDCPSELGPSETCRMQVTYSPKNQDPLTGPVPEDIKEISYGSNVALNYIKDPRGGTGGLNAYFTSISSNIEARFKVNMTNMVFENPVISGNREFRTFKINNNGYREGIIKAISFRDNGGAFMANCVASGSSASLSCQDLAGTELSLAQFPFHLKDRDGCLTTSSETPKFVGVASGCTFDLNFQPSVDFITDMPDAFQDLQVEVTYDSRWRGNETIITKKLFNLSAKSIAAARIALDRVEYLNKNYTSPGDSPWEIDLGRLTLQSPSYFKRKSLMIYFKNVGSVEATNVRFKDASGKTFDVGDTINLGPHSPKYYNKVTASSTTCKVIAPGKECSLTMEFAAIGLATNEQEYANMFDTVDENNIPYKGFQLTYKSGALYNDENIKDAPDYQDPTIETRLKATLVTKGLLMEFTDNELNVTDIGGRINTAGDTIISHIYLRNIGTGPVPYFRLLNPPGEAYGMYNVTLLPTPNPGEVNADYDCLYVGDVDLNNVVPLNAIPEDRSDFASLEKDKSCVFTVQFKVHDQYKKANPDRCSNNMASVSKLEEGRRYYRRANTDNLEFCGQESGTQQWPNIKVVYFDGDISASNVDSVNYGNKFALTDYTYRVHQGSPAKLSPNDITPWFGATLYRPSFGHSVPGPPSVNVTMPEYWFYGPGQEFFSSIGEAQSLYPFTKADQSRYFVPSMDYFTFLGSSADYVLYLGSIPEGQELPFRVNIRNYGTQSARILDAFYTASTPGFTSLTNWSTLPQTLSGSEGLQLSFNLLPQSTGEQAMMIEVEYENGRHLDELIYVSDVEPKNKNTAQRYSEKLKLLVLANVLPANSYPKLSLNVQDYEVVQNPGLPPTETVGSLYSFPLSWNTTAPDDNLVFDTVKLTATPQVDDVYAKKRLVFTNNSTHYLDELSFLFRDSATDYSTNIVSKNFKTISSTCSTNLAPGQSCEMTIKYQPGSGDSTHNFLMTATYKVKDGIYLMQNTGISLLPRSPGQVIANNKTEMSILYKVTPSSSSLTRSSYALEIGTQTLNTVPKTFNFNQSTPTAFQKVELVNTESTKASLLLAYQKLIGSTNIMAVPSPAEYRSVDGEQYAPINLIQAPDGSDRVLIEASKGCFFGDDENDSSVPAHQKGFDKNTLKPCYLIVTFSANFDFLQKDLKVNNGDDMRMTASEIWYYSVNRNATASLWIHIMGKIEPDYSIATGTYGDVQSLETRNVSFSVPKFKPANPAVGEVVGIRVLLGQSKTALNDAYGPHSNYFDIRPYDAYSPQFANFTTGLTNGQFFFFRAVAIRYHPDFVDTNPKRFIGLNTGEYLSADNALKTPLTVLVPPPGHYYFHEDKSLVDKQLTGGIGYNKYADSSKNCTSKKVTLKNPSSKVYTYKLIDIPVWEKLLITPEATNYSDMTRIAHWVSDPPASVDAEFGMLPGFMPGVSTQTIHSSGVFYIRNSAMPSAPVNQVVGGIPGSTVSNYWSLVSGEVGFANSRCMVELP